MLRLPSPRNGGDTLQGSTLRMSLAATSWHCYVVKCDNSSTGMTFFETTNWHADVIDMRGVVPENCGRLAYRTRFLIHYLILVHVLRDASRLRLAIICAMACILPPGVLRVVGDRIDAEGESSVHTPHPSVISRARFILDVGLMLFKRQENHETLLAGGNARYVMIYSSDQHGRDLELISVMVIPKTIWLNCSCQV